MKPAANFAAGTRLRELRTRRRLSQQELAARTGVSQRHLSCIETGRARASREMLVALLQAMEAPLAERNSALLAAGFAPIYGERAIDAEDMAPVREALAQLLAAHDPAPALVLDAAWNILQFNGGMRRLALMLGMPAAALETPINLLRATFAPGGLASRYVNADEICGELWSRVSREAELVPQLRAIVEELRPHMPATATVSLAPKPLLITRLRSDAGELQFFSTLTTFGAPLDVTVASLRVEYLFPADAATRALFP